MMVFSSRKVVESTENRKKRPTRHLEVDHLGTGGGGRGKGERRARVFGLNGGEAVGGTGNTERVGLRGI